MRKLFIYGSLRHLPLLEIVLGREASQIELSPAVLPGYRVSAAAEGPFPTIAAENGAQAGGLLIRGLSDADIARLDFYEGAFDYDLVPLTLADGQGAEVYLPQPGRWQADGPWSLAQWEADWAALSCHAAREVMGYMGRKPRAEVDAMFPMIRRRAHQRVLAAQGQHDPETLSGKIEIARRERVYANFFALDEFKLRHETFAGGMSEPMERAVFVSADAALVLPYDPIRDRVLLVEQMRMGPLARGDNTCWQLEPIAGHIDVGESAEQAARREAHEEAGIALGRLEPVSNVYASPGNATEFFHIFVGLADLPDAVTGTGGLASEHEDIRSHLMSFDDLMALADAQALANAPLVASAYWLARHRERLRSEVAEATPEAT
ncbi:NUDIX domain-containing protein [Sulfitobacter delicatus]|uniref:ADP-ribose pyrophosphatase n=1 Tax=Sulfitobacter delicatus TaxID=218672 RepID=A0A1G7QUY7_9RHOB|nr:NUDIX domain-containing protein [Sulfitobacter delicatus]SDG02338.1 nudix-type nucleoside diphosphatase, YffH/AdpP family [Sulfitobacter delicatus]